MIIETIEGQIVAKANHYRSVGKRLVKDSGIRDYERIFALQCKHYRNKRINKRFKLVVKIWYHSVRFDLDNSLKTLLDCLQSVGAITNDNLCYKIEAEKCIDKDRPRVEFALIEIDA